MLLLYCVSINALFLTLRTGMEESPGRAQSEAGLLPAGPSRVWAPHPSLENGPVLVGGGPWCRGAVGSGQGCAHTTPTVYRSEQSAGRGRAGCGIQAPCTPCRAGFSWSPAGRPSGSWGLRAEMGQDSGGTTVWSERGVQKRAQRSGPAMLDSPVPVLLSEKIKSYLNRKNHTSNRPFLQTRPSSPLPSPISLGCKNCSRARQGSRGS